MNIVKIKSIKKINLDSNLYDIETKKNHNFFANGVLVHNSNLSFWTDGDEVRIASRSQFVDGQFYNCQEVFDRYRDNIIRLKNEYYSNAVQIAVYGELYGPGIQKGIYYSERKDFRAFEIKIFGEVESSAVERPMTAKLRFATCGIPQVPYINIYNDVYEALAENNVFDSKVCKMDESMRGLVAFCEYTAGENDAEGLVIQPLEGALYTGNGARVMIKSKNPKFTEKNRLKNKESKEFVPNPFMPIAEQYVNQNRLDAVMSKFGEATNKDFGRIIGLMCVDVIDDMIKDDDLPIDWKKQDKYKLAGKAVSTVVANFLKEKLLPEL